MMDEKEKREFERVLQSVLHVQKGLATMNFAVIIASGLMWVVSLWASVSDALKHGLSWEVIQIVDGIRTVSTRNTILNVGMSGVFLFIFLTAILSYSIFVVMVNAREKRSFEA